MVVTCGASWSLMSMLSVNEDVVVWVWVLSKVSVKVYEPAQNASVSQLNVNWPVLPLVRINVLAPVCGTPFDNIVVEPAQAGPFATSVLAAKLVTGLPETALAHPLAGVAYKSSVSVHVMGTMLPCTAFAGDATADTV